MRALDRLQDELNGISEGITGQSDRLAMIDKAIRDYETGGTTTPGLGGGRQGILLWGGSGSWSAP